VSGANRHAATIISAQSGIRKRYITAVQCGRNDAGTSTVYVTLNDDCYGAAESFTLIQQP
jgi:hypothetical protein